MLYVAPEHEIGYELLKGKVKFSLHHACRYLGEVQV